jgi:hypothetical protein
MRSGARTPEELDTLLEDALVMAGGASFAELFQAEAVLALRGGEARGERIVDLIAELGAREPAYVADPRRVLQAGDTALLVADRAITVMRRADDRRWRYAIALFDTHPRPKGTHP